MSYHCDLEQVSLPFLPTESDFEIELQGVCAVKPGFLACDDIQGKCVQGSHIGKTNTS